MATSGDEGIRKKFFGDLKRLFPKKPEVDGLVQDFENVGLKSNQSDASSEESKFYSVEGDDIFGNGNMQHPIRPEAKDCSFFVRTGKCKFGPTCIFNHPVLTKNLVDMKKNNGNGVEGSSRNWSQVPCKFYPTRFCKYGEFCRFTHSISGVEKSPLQLNFLGFPIRLGKNNCHFYMRTGRCGFGMYCKFHHPDPTFTLESEQYSPVVTGESLDNNKEASEITPHFPESTEAPECNQEVRSSYVRPAPNVKTFEDLPQDPPKREPCVLNDVGLPIRPGKKMCWNYENLGLCKLGRACAYDHPEKQADGSASEFPSGGKIQETHK